MSRGLDQKVGKYEVVDKVGEGGMGVVYKARDPLLGRVVAIKKMTGDFAGRPEWRDRFFTEAKVVASLNHPNIVTLYDVGIDGESPYIVMEFLEGQGLDKLLSSGQYMSAVQKIDYVIQVCTALHCAHSAKPNGIIHRDIKPANVIVLADLVHIKLVDFGIAKIGGGQSGHSTTGMAIGTSGYMSPQQLLAKKDIDGRTDVFSTGVMLYQMFAGVLPWDAGDAIATAMKILNEPFPPLDTYVGEYPRELDDVLARALAKDVDERYSSAEEMGWDLAHVQEKLKRGLVSEYVNEARRAVEAGDLIRAKSVLADVLKLDTQNSEAREMMHELQKKMQREQSSEKVKTLQAAAEGAAARKQFTEAISSIEAAIKLDKSNSDLMRIRDLIVADQKRYADVRKKLNLAEAAQKMEDYQEALSLVDRALELDPTDTQARMMQAAISKRINDQGRQKQVKDLAEAARKEIQARQFTSAQNLLSQLEAADPAFAELNQLKKAAATGLEQEQRRRNLQQAASAIQAQLSASEFPAALQLATEALQKYPNEPLLLELKSKAESQKQKAEQDRYIEDQVTSATKLLGDREPTKAVDIAEQLAVRFPADQRVQGLLDQARKTASDARNERRRADLYQRAEQALKDGRPEAAIHLLEAGVAEFPAANEFKKLLATARDKAEAQRTESSHAIAEVERSLAAGKVDEAIAAIDAQPEAIRTSTELVRLREIAVEQRKRVGAIKKQIHAIEQQIQQGKLAEAAQALAACRAEFGDDARIEDTAELLQLAKVEVAERDIKKAMEKAESLLRKSDYKDARAVLEKITGELLLVPRDLQTKFSALREQINQAERQVKPATVDHSTQVADFGSPAAPAKPASPPATDVIHFGAAGVGTAPAREQQKSAPVEAPREAPRKPEPPKSKQDQHVPQETAVLEAPKTQKAKPHDETLRPELPKKEKEKQKAAAAAASAEAAPAPKKAPAPQVAPVEEKKGGKGLIIGVGAAVLAVAIGAGVFFMKPSPKPVEQTQPTATETVQPGAPVADVAPPVAGKGSIQLDATPFAHFVIKDKDGTRVSEGDTPALVELPEGAYTADFSGPGGARQSAPLNISAGKAIAGPEITLGGGVDANALVKQYK